MHNDKQVHATSLPPLPVQKVKRLLRKRLRGATKTVLTESLPFVLMSDGISKPDELCFTVDMYPKEMVEKALRFINDADKKCYCEYEGGSMPKKIFFLRSKDSGLKLTKKLLRRYCELLQGKECCSRMDCVSTLPNAANRIVMHCNAFALHCNVSYRISSCTGGQDGH